MIGPFPINPAHIKPPNRSDRARPRMCGSQQRVRPQPLRERGYAPGRRTNYYNRTPEKAWR
jgi:hypothetical protein